MSVTAGGLLCRKAVVPSRTVPDAGQRILGDVFEVDFELWKRCGIEDGSLTTEYNLSLSNSKQVLSSWGQTYATWR